MSNLNSLQDRQNNAEINSAWFQLPDSETEAQNSYHNINKIIQERISKRIEKKCYSGKDINNISVIPLRLMLITKKINHELKLNAIRELCQQWQINPVFSSITSHRKVVGPVIVKAKKIIFPIINYFTKPVFNRQKDFNAAVISAIAASMVKER